ncbi:MAG TPA: NADH-ubiquinone oxidoreductase-F iron-sulfur binding region domain-containing protein [Mycobacteriales bacterium]|nr:NADH-ubiquinone oxidoreductase-F iron-sulfur binding region domain-containing protein [Mycobacteriales bacterium]
MTAPPSQRRTWPDPAATGEWVREDIPGLRAPSRAATGEITGEWPTGMWERRAVAPAVERAAGSGAAGLPRLLAAVRPDGRPVTLAEHRAAYGPLNSAGAGRVIAESGLRGRGGAGFPVEAKVRAVRAVRGKAVVVVNGAAGDPLGEKDTFLISRVPHLILDGAQVAADAVEARQIMVSVVQRTGVYDVMERALAERRRAKLDEVPMKLVPAPDRYVTGESSATAQHLSGGAAVPLYHPPHTSERGVKGRPTLVQNVETMANLALLSRYGASWFREVGEAAEPGSLVLTIRGAVAQPAVVEVPVGTTVEAALSGVGWLTEPVGAMLIGGCAGRWLPATTALATPLSHAGMATAGGSLGAGIVIALPDRACGLDETARLARYLADQSAGQCGACLNGLPAIAGALSALATGKGDRNVVARLHRWCSSIAGRGACSHPDGTAGLVASALEVFAEDVERHLSGWCGRPVRGVLPLPSEQRKPKRR